MAAHRARPGALRAVTGKRYDWAQLVQMGAVQRLVVTPEQVGLPRDPEPFIELWFGDLNHPDLGRSLLGDNGYDSLRSRSRTPRRLLHDPHRGCRILQGLGLCARRHLRPRAGQAGR
jgi:transcriptional regulator of nitric oxide reductase